MLQAYCLTDVDEIKPLGIEIWNRTTRCFSILDIEAIWSVPKYRTGYTTLVITLVRIDNGCDFTSGSESNLLGLPVLAALSLNTPSDGSLLMRWRNNRGSKWRKTFVRPVRSWKERWKMPIMITKQACSDRVSVVSAELVYLCLAFLLLNFYWSE